MLFPYSPRYAFLRLTLLPTKEKTAYLGCLSTAGISSRAIWPIIGLLFIYYYHYPVIFTDYLPFNHLLFQAIA